MIFANKEYFLLLLLAVPYILWYFLYRRKTEPTMRMSDTHAYRFTTKSWRQRLIHLPMLLRLFAFVMVVVVLARPRTHNSWGERSV
jgi:Ca-activated chloride channel family protein